MSSADPQSPGEPEISGVPTPSRWRFADGVPPVWLRRVTVALGVLVVLVLLGVVGSIVLPGWWAAVVTGWVQGITSAGILVGLACGVVFTALPAAIIWFAVRSRWQWRTRLIVAAAAAVLALPNVLTLVIDVGRTSSAYDARLDMVIGAPAFTGSTLIGALLALLGVVGGVLGWRWLRWSRAELRSSRGEQTPRRGLLRRGRGKAAGGNRSESDATPARPQDAQGGGVQ
ncbi:hypothetical protein [Ruania albidiflava]|uniref:hypothetical protein n=1 Tax=Ruania albidiflava TaxID=366586 RepID=UPI0003B4852D|nr:hypothetical protein [Ruania albidiflava]